MSWFKERTKKHVCGRQAKQLRSNCHFLPACILIWKQQPRTKKEAATTEPSKARKPVADQVFLSAIVGYGRDRYVAIVNIMNY